MSDGQHTDGAVEDDAGEGGGSDRTQACPDGGAARALADGSSTEARARETVGATGTSVWATFSPAYADQTLGVARREYRVLARARWPYGLALLFAAFSLAVVGLSGSPGGPTGAGALLVTLGELSVYLVPLAALAMGYGTVVGAAERGTLERLLSLPLPRGSVLVGKFLGRAASFAAGVTVGLGAGAALVTVRHGFAVLPAYLHYTLTAVATGVAFLAVGVCISAAASEKARALGGALLAWAWFALVYDLVALGVVVAVDLPGWALSLVVLGNPADVLRVVVLSLVPTSGGGVGATLATSSVSAPLVVAALLAWTVVPVLVGSRLLAARA